MLSSSVIAYSQSAPGPIQLHQHGVEFPSTDKRRPGVCLNKVRHIHSSELLWKYYYISLIHVRVTLSRVFPGRTAGNAVCSRSVKGDSVSDWRMSYNGLVIGSVMLNYRGFKMEIIKTLERKISEVRLIVQFTIYFFQLILFYLIITSPFISRTIIISTVRWVKETITSK